MVWTTKPPAGIQLDFTNPINNGLVGCWMFNEGTGTVANDISGNNNNGNIVNAIWNAGRTTDKALLFTVGSTIEIPYSTSLDITDNFTMNAWIYHTNSTGYFDIILTRSYLYYFGIKDTNNLHFWGKGLSNVVTTDDKIPYNEWKQVTVTYNGVTMKLYINGILNKSSDLIGILSKGTQMTTIGTKDTSGFNGIIDEVRFWNRTLTQIEIDTLHTTPYSTFTESTCPSMICSLNVI